LKRVETLDGLRGYAVLMILLAHLPVLKKGLASQWLNGVPAIMRFGYLGVDLFFALSGFLITRILINEKRQNSYSFKRFYIRRALRIFPAYYLCIILVGILISNSQLIPVALYYNNYYSVFAMENPAMAHSWTLAVEEHFYLLWPVLLYFLDLKNAKRVISFLLPTFAILSGICAYLMFNQMDAGELLYKSTNSRMLTLALGSYMAFREDECRKLNFRKLSIYFAAAMLLYFLAFWFTSDQLLIVRQWATFLCVPPLSLVLLISAIRVNED
jgi:peptidoglycan/LPS O-acetylase OafA/YrhL